MPDPNSLDDYSRRFFENSGVEGFGLETASIFPCPFCAAPRWAVAKIIEAEQALSEPHDCSECGRSAKFICRREAGALTFELVQTGGPDQPAWLQPAIRRVDG